MILGKLEVELRTPPSAGAKFRFARDTPTIRRQGLPQAGSRMPATDVLECVASPPTQ
jgi:hypothetical protein